MHSPHVRGLLLSQLPHGTKRKSSQKPMKEVVSSFDLDFVSDTWFTLNLSVSYMSDLSERVSMN